MDLWLASLVLIHLHHHCHHPSLLQQHPEFTVSVLSFLSAVLFLWRADFCPFSVKQRAAFQLSLLSKYVVRIAHFFGPLTPIWLPQLLSHLSGGRTVPWPLDLRLLASAELLLYQTSLPPPNYLENHLIWVDSIKVIPLACCIGCPLHA